MRERERERERGGGCEREREENKMELVGNEKRTGAGTERRI
jgi:hypothetical protein